MSPFAYICLGLVAGWGIYRVLRTGKLFSNPDWRIEWSDTGDPKFSGRNSGFGVVYIGDIDIGSVENIANPGRQERWTAIYERQMRPLPGEYSTPEKAAAVVYDLWISRHAATSAPEPEPAPAPASLPPPNVPPRRVDVAVPDWVTGVVVEELEWGVSDRLVVRIDGKIVGFMHGSGNTWEAHAIVVDPKVDETRKILLKTTSRKYGVAAIYTAAKMLKFLAGSFERGSKLHHTKEVYKKLPPLEPFGPHRYVEKFVRTRYYDVMTANEIAKAIGVPFDYVRDIGLTLAKTNVIYGAVSREQVAILEKQEEVWDKPGQREATYGPKPQEPSKRRRIIGTTDITKVRKAAKEAKKIRERGLMSESGQRRLLPKTEEAVPRITTMHEYSFSMRSPENMVGFFDFTSGKPKKKELHIKVGDFEVIGKTTGLPLGATDLYVARKGSGEKFFIGRVQETIGEVYNVYPPSRYWDPGIKSVFPDYSIEKGVVRDTMYEAAEYLVGLYAEHYHL